jgi:hypothetical protein
MGVSGQRHAPAALYPRGKGPQYPLDKGLGGPQSRSDYTVVYWNHSLDLPVYVFYEDKKNTFKVPIRGRHKSAEASLQQPIGMRLARLFLIAVSPG